MTKQTKSKDIRERRRQAARELEGRRVVKVIQRTVQSN